jgi:hypothetical protein
MNYQKSVTIKANSEAEAQQIADAMSSAAGVFNGKEWQAIAKKIQNKIVQMRIRILIQ